MSFISLSLNFASLQLAWILSYTTNLFNLLPVDFGSGTKASQSRSWKQHIQNAIDDI
jgi:hypothetical protein